MLVIICYSLDQPYSLLSYSFFKPLRDIILFMKLIRDFKIKKGQTIKSKKKEDSNNLKFKVMKRVFFAVVLVVAMATTSFSRDLVAEGKTHSALGDFKIEIADNPVKLNGVDHKAFIISYQNTPMEVTVVVTKGKNCKNYVVLSDKLSIQYVCNEYYFGVKLLDPSFEKDGYKTSTASLNRSEYFHQKAITSGKKNEVENTMLIAAYFPMLINN